MSDKLTPRQKAQLGVLEALPARFQLMHRLIEEMLIAAVCALPSIRTLPILRLWPTRAFSRKVL